LAEAGADLNSIKYSRQQGTSSGVPWIIECAFGYCPDAAARILIAGVNWSPAIANPFRSISSSLDSLDEVLANQYVDHSEPVILLVHLASPVVEYTDRGKSALAISHELGAAIIEAVTAYTKAWAEQRKAEERRESTAVNRLSRRKRHVTVKEVAYESMEEAYLAASANGELPASARQVMYQARPLIQGITSRPLDDQYFTQTLLPDYMQEAGVDWDVVFDDRGHFTEPHTEETIGLGTLSVRDYTGRVAPPLWTSPDVVAGRVGTNGPEGRYGAVLFLEKEGFAPLLKRVRLAERFDIAVMSTKGVSNTSPRQLVDKLGPKGIPLLVLHDFDKAGSSPIRSAAA
jgi:hypothetical protein